MLIHKITTIYIQMQTAHLKHLKTINNILEKTSSHGNVPAIKCMKTHQINR